MQLAIFNPPYRNLSCFINIKYIKGYINSKIISVKTFKGTFPTEIDLLKH
jgi:hypothetical protein